MEASILTALLEIGIYSTGIYLAVLLFRTVFGKWMSPALRYGLWFLVVLRLIVPVTFESGFHFITIPQETAAPTASPAAATLPPSDAAVWNTPSPNLPAESFNAAMPNTMPEPTGNPVPAPVKTPWWTWQRGVLLLWCVGFAVSIGISLLLALRLRGRIRKLSSVPDRTVGKLLRRAEQLLEIRRAPSLRLMPDLKSPALTVSLRPILLLPERFTNALADEELTLSLLHELTHYKRKDHLVSLLLLILRAVWWFHPVAWLLVQSMRIDMEAACDARVARSLEREENLRYVNLLLELGQEDK